MAARQREGTRGRRRPDEEARLVRMSETLAEPIILTTDADFHVYRRHGRQSFPA